MQSSRLIFFFKIWAVVFATTLYFAQASIAQSHEPRLIRLLVEETGDNKQELPKQDFVIYGRAENSKDAGIAPGVDYRPIRHALVAEFDESRVRDLRRMPDLESFFTFGGTLELLTPTDTDPPIEKLDIVISELMWGVDTGVKDSVVTKEENPPTVLLSTEKAQWIELYNTTNKDINAELYLLFTPFVSYPKRDVADFEGNDYFERDNYKVLDAVSTLYFGKWELPGKKRQKTEYRLRFCLSQHRL